MMNEEPEYEVLREIWVVTEMRDDSVYKTEFSHEDWVPMGVHGDKAKGLIYCPLPNGHPLPFSQTIRKKKGV